MQHRKSAWVFCVRTRAVGQKKVVQYFILEIDCENQRSDGCSCSISISICTILEKELGCFEVTVSHCPVDWFPINGYSFDIGSFCQQIGYHLCMIMIGSNVQGGNLPLFDLIWRVVQLFYKILDQIEVSMLDCRQESRVPILILERMIHFQDLDHMPHHFHIPSRNCEMQGHFPFRFFEVIQQPQKRGEILEDRGRLGVDPFLEIDEEQLELPNFQRGDGVDDFLEELGDLLIFLKLPCLHQQHP